MLERIENALGASDKYDVCEPPKDFPESPVGEATRLQRPSKPKLRLVAAAAPERPRPEAVVTAPAERLQQEDWHTRTIQDVIEAFETDAEMGLSEREAFQRLRQWGSNSIDEQPSIHPEQIFVRQFTSLPVGMLVASAVISLASGGVADALLTLAVVGINAGIGFATESGSERTIRRMSRTKASSVRIRRAGADVEVEPASITPGDILVLHPNAVVAADARLIYSDGLELNEALLTGESEPVGKISDARLPPQTAVADRHNMVHQGSFVVTGAGAAVVTSTGTRTQVGRMTAEAHATTTPKTPLERDLDTLGRRLAVVAMGTSLLFLGGNLIRGRPLLNIVKSTLALAIAAVPEGLPMTATTTLALGLSALRQKGMVVRRLSAVEALGALQVVCFDKTGTLTANNMRLEEVLAGAPVRRLIAGEHACNLRAAVQNDAALRRLLGVALLCTEAGFEVTDGGVRAIGTATEAALAQGALDAGLDHVALTEKWPRLKVLHRSERRRYMKTLHYVPGSTKCLLAAKGDPRQILDLCDQALAKNGEIVPLSNEDRRSILQDSDKSAGAGLRVLGFAFTEGDSLDLDSSGLIWLGAAALKNPLMEGATDLIARLRQAGVRSVMITGDQAATAGAIAAELGLNGDKPVRVLDSRDLDHLDPELLSVVAQKTDVFARIPPTQKLRIVEALQRAGFVVGMTGDGFNDAPALSAADIAIAVGEDSASVARDVADVIVGQGDLRAIGDGVEQGRAILSNIRKSVHFMVSTNLSEIMVLIAESLMPGDQQETPLELLWLNLVTDILPGLGLALERPDADLMTQPPRHHDEPLLTGNDLAWASFESLIISTGVLAAHGYGVSRYGPGPQTRTLSFMSLVSSQLMHALTCRHDRAGRFAGRSLLSNSRLNLALIGSFGLQGVALASPTLRRFLGIGSPRLMDFAVSAVSGAGVFMANEAITRLRTRIAAQKS